jgi:predicted ester cyclase
MAEGESKTAVTEENKAIIGRLAELWNTGNLAIADEIFDADLVNHNPNNPGVINSESYKGYVPVIRTGFPDFHVAADDLVAEGEKVAFRWTIIATHQGELMGIPATGIQVVWTGITMARFADGKIVEMWWSEDMLGMLQQLGVIPPMPDGPPPMQRTAPEDFVWSALSKVIGNPGNPEKNKAMVLREELEGWARGDVDVALEAISPNFVNHDPIWPGVTDYESYKQWVEFELDEPLNLTVDELIAEEDKVAERWTIDIGGGTTISGMSIHRFADGKIVERWWSKNLMDMLQQRGIIPPLG